jgi:hypothetical protein
MVSGRPIAGDADACHGPEGVGVGFGTVSDQ